MTALVDAGPSPCTADERPILRILAVLNAETERAEPGYEARARLYFYLGFQRYVMLRWLSASPGQEPGLASSHSEGITGMLQILTSPLILDHAAIDEEMHRDIVIRLSAEMRALLRVNRNQGNGCLASR